MLRIINIERFLFSFFSSLSVRNKIPLKNGALQFLGSVFHIEFFGIIRQNFVIPLATILQRKHQGQRRGLYRHLSKKQTKTTPPKQQKHINGQWVYEKMLSVTDH